MPKLGYYEMGVNNAVCDQCGRAFKSNQLKKRWDNAWTCTACWEPRHPQDFVKGIKDNQAPALDRPRAPMPQYYADFPTGTTNYASVAGDPTILFGNQLDVRVKVAADNWSAGGVQIFIGKSSAAALEWCFGINSGASMFIQWRRPNGLLANAISTAFPSLTNLSPYYLRFTLQLNSELSRKIDFYTSTDYDPIERSGSWSAVGAQVSAVTLGSQIPNTGAPINLKLEPNQYPTANLVGKFYYAEVLSAIDGPTVYSFDANNAINDTMVSSPNGIWNLYNGATMVEI